MTIANVRSDIKSVIVVRNNSRCKKNRHTFVTGDYFAATRRYMLQNGRRVREEETDGSSITKIYYNRRIIAQVFSRNVN